MHYFLLGILGLIMVGYVIYGINFEAVRQQENKNDERWRSVVAKADSVALTTFYIVGIIMAGITLAGDVLRRFVVIRTLLSRENLFELYQLYTLFILCLVFAVRTYFLKRFDRLM